MGDEELQKELSARTCLMGVVKMNIKKDVVELLFGTWNYQALNTTEGNRLYDSMMENGIQRYRLKHTILIIMPVDLVEKESLNKNEQFQCEDELPMIQWTAKVKEAKIIQAVGGRHRQYVVKCIQEKLEVEAVRVWKQAAQVGKKAGLESERHQMMKVDVMEADKKVEDSLLWLVKVYNQSE